MNEQAHVRTRLPLPFSQNFLEFWPFWPDFWTYDFWGIVFIKQNDSFKKRIVFKVLALKWVYLQFVDLELLISKQLLFLREIFEMVISFLSKITGYLAQKCTGKARKKTFSYDFVWFRTIFYLVWVFAIFIFHFRLTNNKSNFDFDTVHFRVHFRILCCK